MTREFQIRIENKASNYEDCVCYSTLAEANEGYDTLLTTETEGNTYELELVEVLRQDTVCIGRPVKKGEIA